MSDVSGDTIRMYAEMIYRSYWCSICKKHIDDFGFITHVNDVHMVGEDIDEDRVIVARKICYCGQRFQLHHELVTHFVKNHMEIFYFAPCNYKDELYENTMQHIHECDVCKDPNYYYYDGIQSDLDDYEAWPSSPFPSDDD